MKKIKDKRSRNWTLVIYPDSAPADWRSKLDSMRIPWIESPQHDKDVNSDGTIKKAHWHVLLMFATNKSFNQIKEIAGELNAPIPQACRNIVGMVRYFAHIDNPEKYQYKSSDIVGHGGADPRQYLETATQKREDSLRRILAIEDFIDEKGITEFAELSAYCRQKNLEWFEEITLNNTYVITRYLASRRGCAEKEK